MPSSLSKKLWYQPQSVGGERQPAPQYVRKRLLYAYMSPSSSSSSSSFFPLFPPCLCRQQASGDDNQHAEGGDSNQPRHETNDGRNPYSIATVWSVYAHWRTQGGGTSRPKHTNTDGINRYLKYTQLLFYFLEFSRHIRFHLISP